MEIAISKETFRHSLCTCVFAISPFLLPSFPPSLPPYLSCEVAPRTIIPIGVLVCVEGALQPEEGEGADRLQVK